MKLFAKITKFHIILSKMQEYIISRALILKMPDKMRNCVQKTNLMSSYNL